MDRIEIRPLEQLDRPRLREIMAGYTSTQRYAARKQESDRRTVIALELEPLAAPHVRNYWECLSEDDLKRYEGFLAEGFSLGAYRNGAWIGVALAEVQGWNRVLSVWELHVHPDHRRQGIGRRLLDELAVRASALGLRALTVETQNTNVAAIHFYRQAGFSIEGIDLSYYTNQDAEDGEVAVFLRRKLG
ncbi:acetyltransferases [Longilinea arvoryzae]|uniref:Acetyltransferases n=1 Tax=Longilinea arvoryzae TaxID=360412 RepID=A0A0S7B7S0_9CHLR|nr:GNAT family N-acetyltransferase [Longilinea arvoryzae]GAP13500.1 acetyltransferases [Longilinea arvoryzae]